ncbi:MAG TPA: Trm112 family protein [Rhizobiales bacterium]|nr:Trm112 family protein [Hyphomicrobiales bacterium]
MNKPATDHKAADHKAVDPALLEILVCPVTKQSLTYDEAAQELISEAAQLAFPVRDGIPIMLIEEARDMRETNEQSEQK